MAESHPTYEQLLSRSGSFSITRVLRAYLSRWHWTISLLILAILNAFVFLKLVTPHYEAGVTLHFTDKQSEFDEFKGRNIPYLFWRAPKDYLIEKYKVNSPDILKVALQKIDRPFKFYRLKDLRKIDVYPFQPFTSEILHHEAECFNNGVFEIDPNLNLTYSEPENVYTFPLIAGALIDVPGLRFRIIDVITEPGYRFQFHYQSLERQSKILTGKIKLEEIEENLPVMRLSFRSKNKPFTEAFLNHLLQEFQLYTLQQKQASHHLTLNFIAQQKEAFHDSLQRVAQQLENFRRHHLLFDIDVTASDLILKLRDLQVEKQRLLLHKNHLRIVEEKLKQSDSLQIAFQPMGIDGASDANLIQQIAQLNRLLAQRHQLLLRFKSDVPMVRHIEFEITLQRQQMEQNLLLQKAKTGEAIAATDQSIDQIRDQFKDLPTHERQYLYLQSKLQVNQNIYALLLNKELETALIKAGLLPTLTVLTPVEVELLFPKKLHTLVLFLFGGLFLSVLLIFYRRNQNPKLKTLDNIGTHPKVPVIAIIPNYKEKSHFLKLNNGSKYVFQEKINALRAYFLYSKRKVKPLDQGITILITSEQSGEGKSFLAKHLAWSFSRLKKKTLLVNCDLRKPDLDTYFGNFSEQNGLSEWLNSADKSITGLVFPTDLPFLHLIPAGRKSEHPSESLQSEKLKDLLTYAKQNFDIILLDTPPIGLVADPVPLIPLVDHVLFTMRWLFSDPRAYQLAIHLVEHFELEEINVVVNNFFRDPLYEDFSPSRHPSPTQGYTYYYDNGGVMNRYFGVDSRNLFERIKGKKPTEKPF